MVPKEYIPITPPKDPKQSKARQRNSGDDGDKGRRRETKGGEEHSDPAKPPT